MASYKIICADSISYLNDRQDNVIDNFITGLPDMNEVSMDIDAYIKFFRETAYLIFKKLSRTGYAIFIQTDRKINGEWFDKSYHLTDMAYKAGCKLRWHKIILQREVGKIHLQRPTYSHVLCYSYTSKPGKAFEDVIPIGSKIYDNATPLNVAEKSVDFILGNKFPGKIVVDPFVGRGTVGIVCMKKGIQFLGIDIDKDQCAETEKALAAVQYSIKHSQETPQDKAVLPECQDKSKIKLILRNKPT